jgi:hypothetical protein
MMANRHGHLLGDWLDQAEATGLPPLRSLARGLRHDIDAVYRRAHPGMELWPRRGQREPY